MPSVYATEIGMLKRAHNTPRLILNELGAYTTDTAYRIRTSHVGAQRLVGCFVNPLTALSACASISATFASAASSSSTV